MHSTFSLQRTLPTSPIPSLTETCNKLLEWTEPLLDQQQWIDTQEIVSQFIRAGGEGEKLQNSLLNWNNTEDITNWTGSVWFNQYLIDRNPLVINSNVFYYLKSALNRHIFSQSQIASVLIRCVFKFKLLIDNGELSIDTQKDQPLCMAQYKNLFSATRIPQKKIDRLVVTKAKTHIVVLYKEHIFKVHIVNEQRLCSATEIETALTQILATSQQGQNIGILTTMPRDTWANSRLALIDQGNEKQLKDIEDALFAVCLDENSPDTLVDTSQMLLHGDGRNRFFDKALQFIVFNNGKTGVNFEHTGMDGSAMLRLLGYIYDNTETPSLTRADLPVVVPEPLIFNLDKSLKTTLQNAYDNFLITTKNTQTRVINFSLFGKDRIKTFNISPDAFVQIALQLAEYKLYGKCYSAYEAIMTRTFIEGRIDVLYTVSNESMTFIKNFNNTKCEPKTLIDLLRKAAQKHVSRAKECRTGYGIHTHLSGLINRFHAEGEDLGILSLPKIFTDQAYQNLIHTVVCTSTTSEYGLELAGYGPVVDDGYGIRYFTRVDSLCFNITSRSDIKENLDLMVQYIKSSLIEMSELMSSEEFLE